MSINQYISQHCKYILIMKWKQVSRYGMKLHLNQFKDPKKILALDIGTSSTGIAVSCSLLQKSYVSLLNVIQCKTDSQIFVKKIKQILQNQQNVRGVIVGKPIYHQQEDKINKFIQKLTKSLQQKPKTSQHQSQSPQNEQSFMRKRENGNNKQMPYCFEDQSWTTQQARLKLEQFKQAIQYHGHIHKQKELEDGIAAMKIMDRYLAYYNGKENISKNNKIIQ